MLIKYEFLKILRKKSTLIVMAASLIKVDFLRRSEERRVGKECG